MAVRVDQLVPYGYTDTAISTFHAFGDGLIRDYALELGLPTDLRVLTRPEVVIFLREHLFEFDLDAYRPLGDPTRFLAALATLFSRCKDEDISPADVPRASRHESRPRPRPSPRPRVRRRPRPTATPAAAAAEEARRQAELARAYATYQDLLRGQRLHRLRRPGGAGPPARPRVAGGPGRRSPGGSGTSWSTSSRTRTGRRPSSSACSPSRIGTSPSSATTTRRSTRSGARPIDNILGFRERYPTARTVVLRRNYRSKAPILDAAYRLVRFNDPDRLEVQAGVSKRLRAERADPRAAPVRLEAFATGLGRGRLDRRRDRPPHRSGRLAARSRDPRPGERARGPVPAVAQHRRDPVAVLGHVRACTRGPRSASCSRSCGSSRIRSRASTCTPSRPPRSTGSAART